MFALLVLLLSSGACASSKQDGVYALLAENKVDGKIVFVDALGAQALVYSGVGQYRTYRTIKASGDFFYLSARHDATTGFDGGVVRAPKKSAEWSPEFIASGDVIEISVANGTVWYTDGGSSVWAYDTVSGDTNVVQLLDGYPDKIVSEHGGAGLDNTRYAYLTKKNLRVVDTNGTVLSTVYLEDTDVGESTEPVSAAYSPEDGLLTLSFQNVDKWPVRDRWVCTGRLDLVAQTFEKIAEWRLPMIQTSMVIDAVFSNGAVWVLDVDLGVLTAKAGEELRVVVPPPVGQDYTPFADVCQDQQ